MNELEKENYCNRTSCNEFRQEKDQLIVTAVEKLEGKLKRGNAKQK